MTDIVDRWSEAFWDGIEGPTTPDWTDIYVDTLEALRELPAGSTIKDDRGRILFRTNHNGWISVSDTHFSTNYIPLPAEVLYRVPQQKVL